MRSGYCPYCRCRRLGILDANHRAMHGFMSLFTCGLWLPVWLFIGDKHRCQSCGTHLQ